jgi:hypothetical protein
MKKYENTVNWETPCYSGACFNHENFFHRKWIFPAFHGAQLPPMKSSGIVGK